MTDTDTADTEAPRARKRQTKATDKPEATVETPKEEVETTEEVTEDAPQDNEVAKVTEEAPAAKEAPADDEFEVTDMIARSPEYLGVPQYIAAGGLHGQSSPMTIASAKAAIDAWQNQPVKTGKA